MKDIAKALAKGLLAGLVGTAVMTLSETAEMRLTGRQGSTVPGRVGAKLFGVRPKGDEELARLTARVHWGHGVLMGSVRGVLSLAGLTGLPATATHFALVWGGDALLYALLRVAPVPWRWEARELVTDLSHKGVYAAATGAAFDALA